MRSKAEIIAEIAISTEGLLRAFREFPPALFHINPAEGKWSAAEIAGHLYTTERLTNRSLLGRMEPGGEDPEAKIENIRNTLLNFNLKIAAPDAINARAIAYPQEQVLPLLKENRDKLKQIITQEDLTERSLVNHGYFGMLTRVEWAYFHIYHTERHLHQLQLVKEALS